MSGAAPTDKPGEQGTAKYAQADYPHHFARHTGTFGEYRQLRGTGFRNSGEEKARGLFGEHPPFLPPYTESGEQPDGCLQDR